jgi:hypothetical protein
MMPTLLTINLYQQLVKEGYSFLLLKDAVKKDNAMDIVYEPVRNTPSGNKYSCTSIADEMVRHFLRDSASTIRVYIEIPEAMAA